MTCNENKVVFVGQSGTGKSSILERFTQNSFTSYTESTIGASFAVGTITLDQKKIKIDFWDTAGQEKYNSLVPLYYRDAKVGVVVYDITSKCSFDKAKYWLEKLKQNEPNTKCIIVGSKLDLQYSRQVHHIDASTYASEKGCLFIEVSSKTSSNIDILFKQIGHMILEYNHFLRISQKKYTKMLKNDACHLHTKECCGMY